MGRRYSIALVGLALGVAWTGHAQEAPERPIAVRGPWDLSADQVEYERERELYVARGNVRITQEGRTLTADWVSLSKRTGVGVASGGVVIREGRDSLHAAFVQFDVETLEGVVFDGRLESPETHFRLEGREVRKTGPESYSFAESRFTTCRCPDPGRDPWAIRAQEAELAEDGTGTARNTTFDVLGVPVLWVPWMTYPLRKERETGFLLPEFGVTSRSGGDLGLPFFWAAAPNVNVILTPSWLFERGFKPRLELEYVFGERSQGEALASYIRDTDLDPDDPSTHFDDDRWAFEWRHDHFLPADWRLKVDARAMSDNLYSFDFAELSPTRVQPFLESRGFVTRHFGASDRVGFAGGVQVADDLQNPDDLDRDDFLLQRLPELSAALLPRRLGPLPVLAALDVRYANFQPADRAEDDLGIGALSGLFLDTGIDGIPNGRERDPSGAVVMGDGSGDDFSVLNPAGTEGDGIYQEGEPLADRGQRLVVNPRVGLPLRLGDRFELFPEVGYHGTFYETAEQDFEERSLFTARVDLRTRLRRRFRLPFSGGSATHLLAPRVAWAWVSDSGQGDNPLLVPGTALPQRRVRQLELDNVVRDPADRIEPFNGVVLALDNRILGHAEGVGGTRVWADLTLAAEYLFEKGDFGLLVVEGRTYPFPATTARFHVAWDPEARNLGEALMAFGWSHPRGHEAGLDYRYLRELPRRFEDFAFDDERFSGFRADFDRINQLGLSLRAALTPQWALTYRGAFSFQSSLSIANQGGVEYISRCRCWAIRLEIEDDRQRGYAFGIRYRLIGIGDDAVRPFGTGRGLGLGLLDVL